MEHSSILTQAQVPAPAQPRAIDGLIEEAQSLLEDLRRDAASLEAIGDRAFGSAPKAQGATSTPKAVPAGSFDVLRDLIIDARRARGEMRDYINRLQTGI